ncbi:hypothetical protein JXQ31_08330 [candidate division KSB1 bacterium]|nr:hypothetical protein [candidate division KSB1 bacterium]
METNMKYDIAIMGNYTKDTIVSPAGIRMVDGGGFNYGAHAAVLMGLKVAAITRLAEEDKRVVETLRKLGVDVYPKYTPESTHMRLFYPTTNVDDRVLSVTSIAGPFEPDQVKDIEARAFLINASTRGEVDLDVIDELVKKNTLVVADAQGYVRIINPEGQLIYDSWEDKQSVLSKIDILKTDIVEAEAMTGEKNMKTAARLLSEFGPKEIVLTHKSGVLVYAEGQYYEAPFLPKELIGRSGRGDTCIASYVSKRLSASAEKATVWAAALTSIKMEAEGPIRRPVEDVEELILTKY